MLVVAVLALITSACAASAEQELEEAITLAFVDRFPEVAGPEATCAALGFVDAVGVEGLKAQGYTEASLASDSAAVEDLIGREPSVVARCVDLEERVAGSLDGLGIELADGCVDAERLQARPLVQHLLTTDPELVGLTGRTQAQLLDVVRTCVDDVAFAELAGLPNPDELADVLIADPFAASNWVDDQDSCVVEAVVASVGGERLAELGIDLDNTNFLGAAGDLAAEELDAVGSALATCDTTEQISRLVSVAEEEVAGCVVDGLDPALIDDLAVDAFTSRRSASDRRLRQPIEDCVTAAVDELFPPVGEPSSTVATFIDEFMFALVDLSLVETGRFQTECLEAGMATVADEAKVTNLLTVESAFRQGEEPPLATRQAYWDFMVEVTDVIAVCIRPWDRLLEDLMMAEVDEEVHPCIRAELDPRRLKIMTDSIGAALWGGDPDAWLAFEQGYRVVGQAVEVCGSRTDVSRWDQYLSNIFESDAEGIQEA